MKSLILGLSLSLAATSLTAQVIYYPYNQTQHTAYSDSWTGGPPIASPGGSQNYSVQHPTYYVAPTQVYATTHTHTHSHQAHAPVNRRQLLVPTYRTNVGNNRLVSGPCGWGGNCTTYDGPNSTYTHPGYYRNY